MANNDITKVEYLLNMPAIEFLNWCAYYKDKSKMIEQMNRKK